MSTRQAIYQGIDAERARQDAKWGGPEHDDGHSPTDWASFIRRRTNWVVACVKDGRPLYYPLDDSETQAPAWRRNLVEIAALAIAAMESFDRLAGATAPVSIPTLDAAMADAAGWGVGSFPDVPPAFVAQRLAEEAAELAAQPCDRLEYADVLILMAHAAAKQGIDLADAVSEKMAINRQRVYDRATLRRIRKAPGEPGPDASEVPS